MKNYLYGIFAIAFLAFTACTNEELPTPGTGPDTPVEHKSGEILVKFSPYVSEILDKTFRLTVRRQIYFSENTQAFNRR